MTLSFASGQDIADTSDNALTATTPTGTNDNSYVVDNTAPTVTSIVRQTPTSSPTNADSLIWRVTFSENVKNVDTADFAIAGTTATVTTVTVATASTVYDVTASGGNLASLDATVTLSIVSGQNIADTSDNDLSNPAPTSTDDNTWVVDNTAPTVAITGVPDTSSAAFTATFTFTEAVTGFVVGDITLGNATALSFMVTSTTVYTALITPTANGAVTVDVAADVATDAAGNGNPAAAQASSTYTMPVPTITIAAGTTPVTEGASAAFTLTRSGGPPGNPELTVNVSVTETEDMVAAADKGAKTVTFQANSATAMLGVATVADSVDETDSVVTATVTANPAAYTVGTSSSATVTVTDDDTRGVTVSAETLAVNEGSSGTYTVKLDSEPTASVTVTPSSGNSDVTVSSALTFTTTNWSTAQTVTVAAAQDSDAVDDSATISHAVAGGDYGAVTAVSVAVTVDDDETADTTAPRVASIVHGTPSSSPTNADSLTWRVTFSEAVSNVDTADFAVSGTNATLSVSAVSGVTGAYDVTASGGNLAGVTATVTLAIAAGHDIQDAASNALTNTTPTGTNDDTWMVDNTAPTVTITGVPDTSSAAFTATFTFTEAVTGFVVGDITLGNATALSFMVTSTTVYTALITPTANGAVTVDVAADVATDAAGNGNPAAAQASSTYTMPVPTITIAAGTTPVTEGASAAFTLTRSGGPPGNPELTVNVSVTETEDMVAAADKGAKTVTFQANSATAMLGVATVADSVDETDSVVTATVTANPATYTVGTSSSATVTVTDDDTRGVTVSAETLAVNEGSSGTYTVKLDSEPTASVTVTPSSGNSDVTVSSALTFTTTNWSTAQTVTVAAAQDSDAVDDSATISHAVAGGDYGAVTAVSVAVTVDDDETADTTAPRVASIVHGTPSSSPTNADSLTWRVTFSEAVSNVDTADFAVSGTNATLSVSAVSGVTGAYDVTASGGNLAGVTATVTLSIAAGHDIQDAASNALTNTTPTGTDESDYVVDNTAPTVAITGVPDTSSAAFTATFTFTEAVTGFVVGDITLGNATASNFTATSTTVYTALITPTANGAVTVDVAADAATDEAGNGNSAATQASSNYTGPLVDTTAPTVTSIVRRTPTSSPTNADSLTWRLTFSEDVKNVDAADFAIGGTTATLTVTEVTASTVYDVTASGGDLASLDATVTLSFASGQNIADNADNNLSNTAPTGADENTWVVDNTAPTVTITGVPPASSAAFTATFTFSEDVTGFTVNDIDVGNGTASAFTATTAGRVYTASITPAASGTVTVDVAAGAARDAAGNGNPAATHTVATALGPESLVSNFGQPADGAAQIIPFRDIVGVLTTGARGATLDSIEFRLFTRRPNIALLPIPSVTLYRASVTDSRATRGERVAALTAVPGTPRSTDTAQTVAFAAPSGTRLEAGATYLVELEHTSSVSVESTTYPAEDAGGAPGWAVDGIGAGNSSPWSYGTTASLLMRVYGTPAGATVATAPEAPASLGATAGDAQVTLSWTPPGSDGGAGIEKYQYRYSAGSRVDPETAWTAVPDGSDTGTSLADERSVSVTELDNGRQYAFELRAVNSVRAGAAATATAKPVAPSRSGVLVSNFGQPVDGAAQIIPFRDIVGVFTTGALGATFGSIEFRLSSNNPGAAPLPSATLYHGSVTDTRATSGTRVVTLTAAPESPELTASAQTITFNAPDGGTGLEAGATYLVVLSESAYVRVASTNSSAQDADGASGWTIDGVGAGNSSPWSYETSDSLLMSVNTAARETTSQQLEAPVVEGAPVVGEAGTDGAWTAGETVEVQLTFSEPVTVDITGGTPSIDLRLGTQARSAAYTSGSGTKALVFGYTLAEDEGPHATVLVPGDSLVLNGGTIVSAADGTVDAVLAHEGAAKAALPVSTRDVADGLTAYFSALPAEHDGDTPFTFEVHFSEAFSISYLTMPGAFEVTNGSATGAMRVDNPHDEAQGMQANKVWAITVQPAGVGDVDIELPATTDCEASGAVCTDDGKALAGSVEARIAGPVAISVADASVTEGAGAVLAFEVTLDRARNAPVTVDYATGEGEATPGDDYVETSGTLTFAPAETSKTVDVEVLEDSHDEGSETMRFTLANAAGARIADGTAIGTIENSDPMPQAWMVRFGRTVGSQVVDALGQRLAGGQASYVTVAGVPLTGSAAPLREDEADDVFGLPEWAKRARREQEARTITADDLRLRSAFHLSSGSGEPEGPAFTTWGRVSTGGFSAQADDVTTDGDVTTGLLGFDAEWDNLLAGVMLSQSTGEGAYRLDPGQGHDAGAVKSDLTGVYPYARINLDARVSAWALAGAGSGSLTLKRDGRDAMKTDLSMRMGALGVQGQVLDGTGPSGMRVNLKSDAMWVGTKSARSVDMVGTQGDVLRLRLVAQGERDFVLAEQGTLTPSAELGLRHDGGDAETGMGVELRSGASLHGWKLHH